MIQKPKAAVIGSGFGGLSLAIRLQAQGFDTTILEKRDLPGGRAYVYKDQGFTFDAGPTVITAPHALEELFDVARKKMSSYVDLVPVSPFYRLLWEDGASFDYSNDQALLESQIRKRNPDDVQGYNEFLKYSKAVFDEGYTKLVHAPFLSWSSMIRVSPQLIRLQAYRSVYSMVSKYIKDPHLRQAFSFHSLLVGGNPFQTSSIYTLIHYLERNWGVFFPKGGTGALVQGLVRLFKDLGGKVLLNAEVDQIETDGGKVTGVSLKDGQRLRFDTVASNAEVMHTYRDLLKREDRVAKTRERLEKMNYSMSLFLIYFGTKRRYPNLAHHSVIFGKRYKGLLQDIFRPRTPTIPNDFSLYLHAPSITDPSLAPEGHEAFYVLSPVPHLGHAPVDWGKFGPVYRDRILDYLEQHYIPGLRENLVTSRIFTPTDFRDTLNSHLGAAFSLEPLLTQSAFFRAHNRDSAIRGLYLVGAGTHPGAGVPGVVNSAKATAALMLEDAGLKQESGHLGASLTYAVPS
jgi:phytoene desaturase